jgi:hypothetical protein
VWQLTAPYKAQQIGMVEGEVCPSEVLGRGRLNGGLLSQLRDMKFVDGKTPYKAWCTSKPRAQT